jgi:signal transduction histidine kinase
MSASVAHPRRLRITGTAPLAMGLALAGAVLAGLATAATVGSSALRPSTAVTALHVACGVTFLLVGGFAAVRRPRNNVGLLMVIAGLTWFVTDLQYLPSRDAATAGGLFGVVTFAVIGHLVVAFPSGRLEGRDDRLVVAANYVWVVVGNLVTDTFWASPGSDSLIVLHRDAEAHLVASTTQEAVNVALAVLTFVVVANHRRNASRAARRALAPALWGSLPILTVVVALNIVGLVVSPAWLTAALPGLTPVAVMTLPIAFLIGLARSSLGRLAVGHLVVELRDAPPGDHLRDALARTLRDPTLRIAYRVAGTDDWVDSDGNSMSLPGGAAAQTYTVLERDGAPVAALVHDRSLDDDPSLVQSVAAAASLALENERLQAEVRARLAEVHASRARIVEAAEAERRRLQRDLHDGAQQRLVAVALHLGVARENAATQPLEHTRDALAQAAAELRTAIAELRDLASGIHPAILGEAGLGPALVSLAERASLPVRVVELPQRRLPDSIEAAAYFVACEALANIAKHAAARSATISARCYADRLVVRIKDDGRGGARIGGGSGLRGLKDRVAALDGTLALSSPPGEGTTVVAELPCG